MYYLFSVSRSLASCQGALLLVDSTQSVQAQTLANFDKAKKLGLGIIPVVTKIDLPNAQPEDTALAMGTTFSLDPEDVVMTSAKARIGITEVLEAIVDRLPSPKAISLPETGAFYGRIVDSWFDEHRGVVCLVQVIGGTLAEGQRVSMYASSQETKDVDNRSDFSVQEIGILTPHSLRTQSLRAGQVGYVIAGLRSTRQARIGDTMFVPNEWHQSGKSIEPLDGYESAKPMLFASIYPVDSGKLDDLFAAVDKLLLNDSSVSVTRDQSNSLGSGLRCGFLGFLHMEVFNQRLKDEFNVEIVMTTPSVPYLIKYESGEVKKISSVSEWPQEERSSCVVSEPIVKVTLVTPQTYYGGMIDIIKERRGSDIGTQYLDDGQVLITANIPWQEVVCDMNDEVKHCSAGYASFNYEEAGYKVANLVKVEIAVNGEACDPLSFVAHSDKATSSGRNMAIKLKDVLSRQQFEIVIQARVGLKVLARERIAPYRKVSHIAGVVVFETYC
jgi:elongation factor 4